jgi:hypothetical protein
VQIGAGLTGSAKHGLEVPVLVASSVPVNTRNQSLKLNMMAVVAMENFMLLT